METQKAPNSPSSLEGKNGAGGIRLPDSKPRLCGRNRKKKERKHLRSVLKEEYLAL